MADKVVLEAEVKSNIGEVSKDASGLASEFQFMGVSLNSLNAGFKSMSKVAKASFATVRAGMISTGVGALVVAVGSLVAWFTKTKKGAEALTRVFTGISAAVNVIVDRLSQFGGGLAKLFTGDIKGGLQDMKGTLSGIGDEMAREIQLAVELEGKLQALTDRERDLNVETAKRRAEIEELKMIAEDVTKSEEERLEAAQRAFDIENNLLQARVANAEEAVRIQQQQMELSENMAADLDELAQKEIALANIRQESATKQIELNNKINAIKAQTEAKERAAQQKWIQRQNERIAKQNQTVMEFNKLRREELLKTLANEESREKTQAAWRRDEREKLIEETVFDEKKKSRLITENLTFHALEVNRIEKKYRDIGLANKKQLADELKAIDDEISIIAIKDEREKQNRILELQEAAEKEKIKKRVNSAEQIEAIEEKYRIIRQDKADKEAEEDKQRNQEAAAAKVAILAQGLQVAMSFMDVQAARTEKNYENEIKLAQANGGDIEAIENKYESKRREQAKKFKAMKIAMAIVETYQAATAAYANAMAIPGAGLALAPISAGLAIAAGLANVAMIEQQPLGGGGGAGGSVPSATTEGPSRQMMSGAFDISGGEAPEPLKAFVVTDEMTNSQNQLANIRRRATI